MIPLHAVEAADAAYRNTVPTGDGSYQHRAIRAALEAAAPYMLAGVIKLADVWEKRGEHDMAFSKTVPDEDIAMVLLTEGASMVENARHIRNAIAATNAF